MSQPPPSGIALQEGFPDHLSDTDLQATIREIAASLHESSSGDIGDWGAEPKLAVLQAALLEQSRRHAEAATNEAAAAQKTARSTARYSLAIAGIALIITAGSAILDWRGDANWQDEQTRILTEIADRQRQAEGHLATLEDIRDRLPSGTARAQQTRLLRQIRDRLPPR